MGLFTRGRELDVWDFLNDQFADAKKKIESESPFYIKQEEDFKAWKAKKMEEQRKALKKNK